MNNKIEELKKCREENFKTIGQKTMQAYYYITDIFKICEYQKEVVDYIFRLERELVDEKDTDNN